MKFALGQAVPLLSELETLLWRAGWHRAFSSDPRGTILVSNREIPVRARKTRGERLFDAAQGLPRIAAGAVDQARRQPFRVVQQNFQEVVGGELLVPLAQSEGLRRLHEPARTLGVFLKIHRCPPKAA